MATDMPFTLTRKHTGAKRAKAMWASAKCGNTAAGGERPDEKF